jgi:hypothetical protein
MRVEYKGKFKEDLNDYINDQPWMFELDGNGQSFWELPVCMQWGVVYDFNESIKAFNLGWYYADMLTEHDVKYARKKAIEEFQNWYNENN